jgi:hypothetical protein
MNSPESAEVQPFPIDGVPTGFDAMLNEEKEAGELDFGVPPVREVCALDLVREAFQELMHRENIKAAYERANAVVQRLGY